MFIKIFLASFLFLNCFGLRCRVCTGPGNECINQESIIDLEGCNGSCVKHYLYQDGKEIIKRRCSFDPYPDGCQDDYARTVVWLENHLKINKWVDILNHYSMTRRPVTATQTTVTEAMVFWLATFCFGWVSFYQQYRRCQGYRITILYPIAFCICFNEINKFDGIAICSSIEASFYYWSYFSQYLWFEI